MRIRRMNHLDDLLDLIRIQRDQEQPVRLIREPALAWNLRDAMTAGMEYC